MLSSTFDEKSETCTPAKEANSLTESKLSPRLFPKESRLSPTPFPMESKPSPKFLPRTSTFSDTICLAAAAVSLNESTPSDTFCLAAAAVSATLFFNDNQSITALYLPREGALQILINQGSRDLQPFVQHLYVGDLNHLGDFGTPSTWSFSKSLSMKSMT